MEKKEIFYKESGRINPIGTLLTSVFCLIAAIALGYLYNTLIIVIPIIYLNFFVTIGLGIILGFVIRISIRLSSNRNRKNQIVQAIVIGLLVNYFQWIAYLLYAYNATIPTFTNYLSNLLWIFDPETFFGVIAEINSIGLWSIFGINFSGFPLSIIWIIEALIIMAGPIVAILTTKVYPYSEFQKKWYTKYTLLNDFESVTGSKKQIEYFKEDPVQSINSLRKGSAFNHSKIHVFYLKDEENQFLTFEQIYVGGNGRGKKKGDITINNLRIDKSAAETILNEFHNNKERWNII